MKAQEGTWTRDVGLFGNEVGGTTGVHFKNLLHMVTQFVTVNDQLRLTVDIALNTSEESTSRLQLQTQ